MPALDTEFLRFSGKEMEAISAMDFSDATQKQFPLCTKFASMELQPAPLKRQKPKVWDAFVRACEKERFAKIAIEWFSAAGPTILPVANLVSNKKMCGSTRAPRFQANIEVDSVIFFACELASAADRDFCRQHFEATVLHELVHWARFAGGANDMLWTEPPIAGAEAGSVFETWAYGRLFCTSDDYNRLASSYL